MLSFKPLGDQGIRIGFSEKISPEINQQIRAFLYVLKEEQVPGIIDVVPTYTTVNLYYQPTYIGYAELATLLLEISRKMSLVDLPPTRLVKIPVLYDHQTGPDLQYVADFHQLTVNEVIQLHTAQPYLVYMLGFSPGFPYLGGLPKELVTPRLSNPRPQISGGSVGIGGEQTGIYPEAAPGGWQIIGHTPVKLYDPQRSKPILLKAGDYLEFYAVTPEKYQKITKEIDLNVYQVEINPMDGEES